MRKLLLLALAVTLTFSLASAQNAKFVFGPLDGDNAGTMIVTNGASITVPVFVKTAPGINVIGFHWPVASNDIYVATRNGINYNYSPFVGGSWDGWQSMAVLAPNALAGYTNQSLLAVKDFPRDPFPEGGINTNGEYWHVADYLMTTTMGNTYDTPFCDAFTTGSQPDNGGFVWSDYATGELPGASIEYSFACLQFTANTDPVWTVAPTAVCGDANNETCFDLAGTDVDVDNNLHIIQTAGPGTFTETAGGPGGVASGTWCGTLAAGSYVVSFELNDNNGGAVPLDVTVNVSAISMDIACVSGFPGGAVSVPVTLHTCNFEMGGMEIYIGYDPTAVNLTSVTPLNRIDNGQEYWWTRLSDPCQTCPDDDAVRITWIADINNGVHNDPAYAGEDPIFNLNFEVSSDLPWGMNIPITFLIPHYSDNTISDPSGYIWLRPALTDGCIDVVNPSELKGDPNMNGWFYEIGDAVLVARRLISGPIVWTENGTGDDAIQESAGDLNNNGVVDVADLVRFINIINGTIVPKVDPVDAVANVSVSTGENIEVSINSGLEIGGVLFSLRHNGIELGTPVANGMDFLAVDKDGVMNVVVYSLAGHTLASGNTRVVSIPVVSNNNGSVELVEASSADAYGRLLQTTASVVAPLPTQISVSQNYPNPFNAKTLISFALPSQSDVNIDIYSVTGQLVQTISGNYEAGNHSVTWDASNVASGVYFYKMTAGSFVQTMKMTLLK